MPTNSMPKSTIKNTKKKCGLCGKSSKKLTKTSCCNNWICDDEDSYKMFSYARNSCSRNHRRFTLCGAHVSEEHSGDWKNCKECVRGYEPEMAAWYGTNEYNFETLENPPSFKPTYCSKCGIRIVLPDGGYSVLCGVYRCDGCPVSERERNKIIKGYEQSKKL